MKSSTGKALCGLALAVFAAAARAQGSAATDSSADLAAALAQIEKKPLEFGGYVEFRQEDFRLNRGAPFYDLNFPALPGPGTLDRSTGTLQLQGKYTRGIASFNFLTNSTIAHDQQASDSRQNKVFESYLSLKPDPALTIDAGKKTLSWGKGYAWNPVGFLQRPKDPNDPTLAREGYTLLSADFIRSFSGPLQTVAFTPVLLPVGADVNHDFGRPGYLNAAAKLYVLYRDTDIDLVYLAGGSKTARFGFDFSRNIGSNIEVHGEWARIDDASRQVVDASGQVVPQVSNVQSWLLGLRYLTEGQTTWIAEYYHNGPGFSEQQASAFYGFVDRAVTQYRSTGSAALLQRAQALSQGAYGGPSPLRNYLYVRASKQDALGIVYFTPAVTLMADVDDHSFSVTPELMYTGFNNWELRARLYLLHGSVSTDFGSKQNTAKFEVYARYYF